MTQNTQTPTWTPSTHHVVPQPAGSLCAEWYRRVVPDAEELLYALAHTKGECERLERDRAELIAALETVRFHLYGTLGAEHKFCQHLDATLARVRS